MPIFITCMFFLTFLSYYTYKISNRLPLVKYLLEEQLNERLPEPLEQHKHHYMNVLILAIVLDSIFPQLWHQIFDAELVDTLVEFLQVLFVYLIFYPPF